MSSSLLFLVHLRRFGGRSDVKLEDIIRSTTTDFSDEEIGEICEYIEKNSGKGIIFVLDGLDEYCPKKRKETLIHQLIQGVRLPNSVVIVASRPAASQKYRRKATKCLEVLGFLKQQIYEYVDSYFSGHNDRVGLKTYLDSHPNVMHMCYLPLHVAMITYLYEIEGTSLPQIETEIYHHFTLSTLLRSIRKRSESDEFEEPSEEVILESFDDLCPDDLMLFEAILELAYQATVVKPQQVFSPEDVKELITKQSNKMGNDESTLGLIIVDNYFVKYGLKEIFTFLHLTFQEFLAACYIARCTVADQESIIETYGQKKNLDVVWKFYCGMTQFSSDKVFNIFELLYSQTSLNSLLHIHCAHESQQERICTYVIQCLSGSITLDKKILNPTDCTALAYVMLNSTTPTTELALTSCTIGPEGFNAFVKEILDKSLPIKTLRYVRPHNHYIQSDFGLS